VREAHVCANDYDRVRERKRVTDDATDERPAS
jgi:hypothetical protein